MRIRAGTRAVVAIVLVLAACGLARARPAGAAPTRDPAPIFECVFKDPTGPGYVSVWGYDNESGAVQSWAVGVHNRFTPPPNDRAQPTTFLTGRHDNVVAVPWDESTDLLWRINKTSVRADRSVSCASTSVPILGNWVAALATAACAAAFVMVAIAVRVRRRQPKAVV